MLARLTGSLMGLSWWTTYVLTPFRLDGLALGAFLAVTVRQPGGLERLVRALPRVAAVVGGLLVLSFVWTRVGLARGAGARAADPGGADPDPAGLPAGVGPHCLERSLISRFFRSRSMVFLGTYSYGLYVYHHFISYYLTHQPHRAGAGAAGSAPTGRRWRCRPRWAQSASLAIAYVSYEFFEKRFLKMKVLFEAKEPAPSAQQRGSAPPPSDGLIAGTGTQAPQLAFAEAERRQPS